MTGILTTVSNQFSKSLIMGTFLPVAIFIVAWLLLITPLLPPDMSLETALHIFGTTWRVVTITFITILITGLLHNFNIPIIRLYEGYPWQKTFLGKWRKQHHQKAFSKALARRDGMQMLIRALEPDPPDPLIFKEWGEVNSDLRVHYPEKEFLVLPTRLGNAIRNFERYPSVQYEIEDIVFWPHLTSVIDDDYAKAIDDATTSFNFMLNLSFLSYITAGVLAGVGLAYPPASAVLRVFMPVLVFTGLGYCFYLMLISITGTWGALVKGAFDLYRWDLLKKMGYQQRPTTRKEERDLWSNITQQTMFGDYRQRQQQAVWEPRVDYVDKPPSTLATAVISPEGMLFEVTRAIKPSWAAGHIGIVIRIKNETDHPVDHLIVTDTLPEGLRYKWMSATVSGYPVRVTGLNPYNFHIDGPLPGQDEVVLSYVAVEYP